MNLPHLHDFGEQPPTLLTHRIHWPCRGCRVAFTESILRHTFPHPRYCRMHLAKGRLWLTLDYDPSLARALDVLERHVLAGEQS